MIMDEVGCIPLEKDAASLFLQLVASTKNTQP
ncbi:hypothetical protein [Arthrobacter sp. 31Y]